MAAEVVKIVDPDNGGGTDYTSLDAWEDALGGTTSGNLPNDDQIAIAQCRNSSGSADTAAVDIDGWTTDGTRDIRITSYTGYRHAGVWSTSKYYLQLTDGNGLMTREDYITIDGIQINCVVTANNTGMGIRILSTTASNKLLFSNLVIKGTCAGTGGGYGMSIDDADTNLIIWNSIVYDIVSGADVNFQGIRVTNGTVNILNSVVHNCYDNIIQTGGTVSCYNTASFDSGHEDFDGTITIDHCASDEGAGTNPVAPSGSDWANEFPDYGTDNFTLTSGGNLAGGGTDDPLGDSTADTDIIGNSRTSPWDIGAFEYIGAEGSSVPIILQQMRRHRQ